MCYSNFTGSEFVAISIFMEEFYFSFASSLDSHYYSVEKNAKSFNLSFIDASTLDNWQE